MNFQQNKSCLQPRYEAVVIHIRGHALPLVIAKGRPGHENYNRWAVTRPSDCYQIIFLSSLIS